MVSSPFGPGDIVEVAVNVPLRRLFHYSVPPELREQLATGHRVEIPFGRQTTTGVCVGFPDSSTFDRLKPIQRILHPECRFDEKLLELTRWIARYYHAPWGEILEAAMPPAVRAETKERRARILKPLADAARLREVAQAMGKRSRVRAQLLEVFAADATARRADRIAEILEASDASARSAVKFAVGEGLLSEEEERDVEDDLYAAPAAPERTDAPGLELSSHQQIAVEAISRAVTESRFAPFLLHGVTGSGKTEVYIRALQLAVELGGSGLVLVPEIALTPQTVSRFRAALRSTRIAVLHSMLSPKERAREWRAIQEGRAKIAIGARSAVFAPFPDLRVIVVDEEHESSYKQDSSPRYHARDVAVMRAHQLGIPIVLGSATPSLESHHNAATGKYQRLELPRRVTQHDLPKVMASELGPDFYHPDGRGLIGDVLDRLIRNTLREKEQVLLFLNRRGYSTYLHCLKCGFVLKCQSCDVVLTYHRQRSAVHCHLCDTRMRLPDRCPECQNPGLRRSGAGTERILEELRRRYPEARCERLDSDAVTSQRALLALLDRFTRREIDILIGTQMIAKGHDFPGVSLVGVVNADTGLHMPDFRAAERTFQLITQVSGRAGRGETPGRVVVQTFFPDHFALRTALRGDYPRFCAEELEHRRLLSYPPFGRVARVICQGEDLARTKSAAAEAAAALRGAEGVELLGPAEAPIARIQDRHRLHLLLKAPAVAAIHAALDRLPEKTPSGVDTIVDVDPYSLL